MKRVLVTGAAGFVGRHVARLLAARGWTVDGLGHGVWAEREWRSWGLSDWRSGDVTAATLSTLSAMPDAIVHCAGGASVPASIADPNADSARTATTTEAVLVYARDHAGGASVVLPSSAAVYGEAECQPIGIAQPPAPCSPYGLHKLRAENLCRQFGTNASLPTAIVRLFSVYGVGVRKQLLWDACGKFMQGHGVFDGDGNETRDWLHVEDAAELLCAAIDRAAVDSPIVNGGSGVARRNRDVLGLLAGGFPDMREIRFTGRRRPGDPAHFHADISRTLAWAWRPQRCFEEELAAYARWFRAGAP